MREGAGLRAVGDLKIRVDRDREGEMPAAPTFLMVLRSSSWFCRSALLEYVSEWTWSTMKSNNELRFFDCLVMGLIRRWQRCNNKLEDFRHLKIGQFLGKILCEDEHLTSPIPSIVCLTDAFDHRRSKVLLAWIVRLQLELKGYLQESQQILNTIEHRRV